MLFIIISYDIQIDQDGMFNEDNAYKLSLKEFPNDETKLENAKKIYGLCKQGKELFLHYHNSYIH